MTAWTAESQRAAIRETVRAIRQRSPIEPEIALVLGTGLGGVADEIAVEAVVPYAELPHLPVATVPGHAGKLLIGRLAGRAVVALQGRFHRYEGYTLQQATFPLRVVHDLGARTLVLSGASGGLDPLWRSGDVVVLDDHLNLLGDNPLIGPNLDELGPRFPDMSEPYDRALRELAEAVALDLRIPLRLGVYAALTGPNLETRAEYRMLRALGADLVGMSTVPEVIVARHMGMRVLAFAVVTNLCLPDALEPADIDQVIRVAREAEPTVSALVRGVLERLDP